MTVVSPHWWTKIWLISRFALRAPAMQGSWIKSLSHGPKKHHTSVIHFTRLTIRLTIVIHPSHIFSVFFCQLRACSFADKCWLPFSFNSFLLFKDKYHWFSLCPTLLVSPFLLTHSHFSYSFPFLKMNYTPSHSFLFPPAPFRSLPFSPIPSHYFPHSIWLLSTPFHCFPLCSIPFIPTSFHSFSLLPTTYRFYPLPSTLFHPKNFRMTFFKLTYNLDV